MEDLSCCQQYDDFQECRMADIKQTAHPKIVVEIMVEGFLEGNLLLLHIRLKKVEMKPHRVVTPTR